MSVNFGVRELAAAFAEGACSRQVSNRLRVPKADLKAAAASCLTESGGKPPHSKVDAHGGGTPVNQ